MMEKGRMMEEERGEPPSYDESYTGQTIVTTTTTSTMPAESIHVDKAYLCSFRGVLKLIQIVLCLVCLITVGFMYAGPAGWGGFCAGTGFFCCLVWFLLYLLNITSKLHPVMFIIEMVYYCVLSVVFLIAGIVAAVTGHIGSHIAFAVFGLSASVAFGIDAIFQFRQFRAGAFQTHQTTTTTTEVRY